MGRAKKGREIRVVVDETAVALTRAQRAEAREIDRLAAEARAVEAAAVDAPAAERVSARRVASAMRRAALAKERALVAGLVGTAGERVAMAGLADTLAQAKLRGEAVEQAKGGAVRVRSRDGLAELFTRNSVTGEQYLAGCAYRELYEACHGGPPSQLRDRVGGGRSADERAFTLAKLGAKRARVEDVVAVAARAAEVDPVLALGVLRVVAGEGGPLNPPGGCSRTKRRRITALRVALSAAAVVLKVAGAVRQPTKVQVFETAGETCAYEEARRARPADPDEAA